MSKGGKRGDEERVYEGEGWYRRGWGDGEVSKREGEKGR